MDLTGLVAESMAADAATAARSWAASGAMALTGRPDRPADVSLARVALAVDALADRFEALAARGGVSVAVPGAALLGERAAIAGLSRRGSVSCGGGSRLLRAADGWLALTLARGDDVELVPAWLETSIPTVGDHDATDELWHAVATGVVARPVGSLVERAALLGLPCAAVGETPVDGPIVEVTELASTSPLALGELVVVDLSSLWAGPLCTQLLGLAGARVIKVEGSIRPDGARRGPPAFFELLHAGHESVALDLAGAIGRRQLATLLRRADVVIEASRPRALRQMGITPDLRVGRDRPGVWVSITGHGRRDPGAMRTGFGDDTAAAGGLVAVDDEGPMFCADAVADPVSGLLAAVAVLELVAEERGGLVDVALARTAAHLAAGVGDNDPVDDDGELDVEPPRARTAIGSAPDLGAHTDAVLEELGV